MDAQELSTLDRRLRDFAIANGMTWVVDELDEAIALGVFERRELRQSSRKGQTVYDEVPAAIADDSGPTAARQKGRKRAEEFVSRRSLTQREQVMLMLSGLRRVLADLDQVAAASIANLNDLASVTQSSRDLESTENVAAPRQFPPVSEIDFAPDEGSSASRLSTEGLRHTDRYERTASVLSRIEAQVES